MGVLGCCVASQAKNGEAVVWSTRTTLTSAAPSADISSAAEIGAAPSVSAPSTPPPALPPATRCAPSREWTAHWSSAASCCASDTSVSSLLTAAAGGSPMTVTDGSGGLFSTVTARGSSSTLNLPGGFAVAVEDGPANARSYLTEGAGCRAGRWLKARAGACDSPAEAETRQQRAACAHLTPGWVVISTVDLPSRRADGLSAAIGTTSGTAPDRNRRARTLTHWRGHSAEAESRRLDRCGVAAANACGRVAAVVSSRVSFGVKSPFSLSRHSLDIPSSTKSRQRTRNHARVPATADTWLGPEKQARSHVPTWHDSTLHSKRGRRCKEETAFMQEQTPTSRHRPVPLHGGLHQAPLRSLGKLVPELDTQTCRLRGAFADSFRNKCRLRMPQIQRPSSSGEVQRFI